MNAVALALALAAPAMAAAPDTEQAYIDAQRLRWNVPGVAVAIARRGAAPRSYAAGTCRFPDLACTAQSPFHIGSTTKFFTGLLAASLAAGKQVDLDAPVAAIWPAFRLGDARASTLSLRDLLGGRSGLGSIDWPYFWDPSLTRADYVARLPYVPLLRPAGSRWGYANANFVAAGTALEQVTGQSWEALVQSRLFAPLAMTASRFALPAGSTRGYALAADGSELPMAPTTTAAAGPAGSITSNAADLAHFLAMLVEGGRFEGRTVIAPAALETALAAAIRTGVDKRYYSPPGNYGLGVFTATYHGQALAHHGGGYAGYSAHFAWLPQAGLAVFVLCNRNASDFPEALALALLDRAQGAPQAAEATMAAFLGAAAEAAPPLAPVVAPARPLAAYAGSYRHPAWGRFTVSVQGDALAIGMGPWQARLDSAGEGRFSFAAETGWERLQLRFEDTDGAVGAFLLDDGLHPAQRFVRSLPAAMDRGSPARLE